MNLPPKLGGMKNQPHSNKVVVYNSQRDNYNFGVLYSRFRQYFSTCAWMLMSYYSKRIKADDDKQPSWYVDQVYDIKKSGAKIKVHPKKPNQEGNVTITSKDGQEKISVRVETHPLPGSNGKSVRHANVKGFKKNKHGQFDVILREHIVE